VSFLTALGLAVAFFVVIPYLAHRLRRRQAEEHRFPPARLVEPAPPQGRRRSALEDRALFATRSAAVLALAVLGATPFVRCSRLSLARAEGASVGMAIVIDDSMSMRADERGAARFERARRGALELLASAREGDATAVVLAGAPARVALAATTDLGAAWGVIRHIAPSDRGTDLDGALTMARDLVGSLPQVDRRVVLLSDLADGHSEAPPLGESSGVPVWVALPELAAPRPDCGILRADRRGGRVRVSVACGGHGSATDREVVVEDARGRALGRAAAPAGPGGGEVAVTLGPGQDPPDHARLTGLADALASDDVAPIASEPRRSAVAVVADTVEEAVATGGAPIVEQALASLKVDVDATPIPALPDRVEDLAGDVGVLLDDPPGLTPEQRHTLSAYLDQGGIALVALGPHAAAAPLGATFEPVLSHAVTWSRTGGQGVAPETAVGSLAESAQSLVDLGATSRAGLAPEDARAFEPMARWSDGAILVGQRAAGRGEVWIVTLPFSVDASDLPLRPAFLSLLDAWLQAAERRAAPQRGDVGVAWRFPGARSVLCEGPDGPVQASSEPGGLRVVPTRIGAYRLTVDGRAETRIASPLAEEMDLRPRRTLATTTGAGVGERGASVDASAPVALFLLALVALELGLRLASRRTLAAREIHMEVRGKAL